MKGPGRRMLSAAAALVVLGSGALPPLPLAAQSPVSVSISPLLGLGGASGPVGQLADSTTVSLDQPWFFGAALEASFAEVPLRVRMGATRTFGGHLQTHGGWASCGTNCTEGVLSSVGDASITTLWGDVVLTSEFLGWWRLAPYAFAGGALRVAHYTPVQAMAEGFDGNDGATLRRYGLGLDVRIVGASELWLEWARSDRSRGSIPPDLALGSQETLTAGVRLSLF